MKHVKYIGLFAALVLVGAGCGGDSGIISGFGNGRELVLEGDHTVEYPEGYTVSKVEGVDRISDGECLIYLSDKENTLVSPNWDKQTNTQKIGELSFNLVEYREAGRELRVDAHLLDTPVHLSLDNPAGFQRCVDDFEQMLTTIK